MPDKQSTPEFEDQVKRRQQVFGSIVDQLKPWLFEFGNWMFGGLIAFNLVIVAPLLTLGNAHNEIIVSIVAFACALPLNVSGLVVLKLSKDMNDLGIDDVVKHAFEDANVPNINAHFPADTDASETLAKKRADAGLRYSLRLAGLSAVLTVLGMVAALWFIGWWVALIFLIVIVVSLIATWNLGTQLLRPDIDREQIQKLRAQGKARQPPTP